MWEVITFRNFKECATVAELACLASPPFTLLRVAVT
jgi:hypothetical protein